MSEEHLNLILSGSTEGLGHYYDRKHFKRQNSHHYRKGKKYLHFFKDKSSMELIRRERQKLNIHGRKYYFCSFNIPDVILFFHRGTGHYDGNYDTPIIDVTEYAIPVDMVNPEWLDKYILDTGKSMDITKEQKYEDVFEAIKQGKYTSTKWGDGLEL